jgi:nonribosomal peptide synthetase MxcG
MIAWPITQAQLGIWLGQAKSPASTRYNTAEYLELNVALNAQSWLVAAARVLQCTTALNVQFAEVAGEPTQRPLAQAERSKMVGEYIDFSHQVAPFEAAKQFLAHWQAAPYSLSKGQLYRHALIKLATNQYLWALGAHHIAVDGFSFALLSNRVLEAYDGGEVVCDEPQYLAVLDEDKHYQNSKAYQQDQAYWIEKLKNHPNAATLRVNDAQGGDDKLKITTTLKAQLIRDLDEQAQQVGANWSELLLAAVALVVHERRGVAQTILGLPVSNRFGSKAANTPCMHMNLVPVCVQFESSDSVGTLLQQISRELKQARRHFRFRYETLNSLAKAEHLPARLFGPVVNILPFEREAECDGEPVLCHTLSAGPVDDLAFVFVKQRDGSLRFDLEGQYSGYTHSELETMQTRMLTLLAELSQSLAVPVRVNNHALALVNTPYQPNSAQPTRSIVAQFFACAKAKPEATVLQTIDGQALSYSHLAARVRKLAVRIQTQCHGTGETILLVLPRSINTVVAMLAVLTAKQRFVFIDVDAPSARNQRIVADAKPILALVDEQAADFMAEFDAPLPCINLACVDEPHQAAQCELRFNESLAASDEAYLIYTSGSTGQPKGVQINHGALASFIAGAREAYQINASDTVLQFAPFHFDACIEEVFLTLTTGATLVLRNDGMLDSFEAFLAQIVRLQITVLDLPTAYWHELCRFACESKLTQLGLVHTIIIGGEAVNRQRIEAWRMQFGTSIRVLNTYGPTETTVVATCIDLSQTTATNSIGAPLPGRGAVVLREPSQIATLGERGELYLTGAGLATGYLDQSELTNNAFVSLWNPITRQRERAYRTGDMVRLLGNGQLEYLGREDAQLKISGYRIEIGEIEAVMLENPAIAEAAVIILRDADGQPKALAAHLVSRTEWSLEALRALFATQLPAPMLPVQVSYYSALPKTPANKIDRKRLAAAVIVDKPVEQLDAFETRIAGVWRDVLGVACIGKEDNFFSIGGQSLHCIQVAARLTKLLDKPVNVAFLFAHPKLGALCEALQGSRETTPESESHWQASLLEDIAEFQARLANIEVVAVSKPEQTTVLLTGATGFVGAQLLHALLSEANVRVICHVRGESIAAAQKRLINACQQQQLDAPDFTRVEIVLADLSAPQLGLSTRDYHALGQRVSLVIHNAAHTSVLRDYSSLKAANTQSTAELLLFAKRFSLPFNHVSTVAVAPPSQDALAEAFVPLHDGLKDGYQRSKWVAEQLVESAIASGVTAQVYRLARVIGTKATGFINSNDLVWRILRSGLKLGCLPNLNVSEPWTPVDVVARFVALQSVQGKKSQIFNLTPESQVVLTDLYAWLREFGFVFDTLPIAQWVAVAQHSDDEQDHTIASFFHSPSPIEPSTELSTESSTELSTESSPSSDVVTLRAQNYHYRCAAERHDALLGGFAKNDFIGYLRYAFATQILSAEQHFRAALHVHSARASRQKEKESV